MNKLVLGFHAIGGFLVSALGTAFAVSQDPALNALVPPKYAAWVAIAGAAYAALKPAAVAVIAAANGSGAPSDPPATSK